MPTSLARVEALERLTLHSPRQRKKATKKHRRGLGFFAGLSIKIIPTWHPIFIMQPQREWLSRNVCTSNHFSFCIHQWHLWRFEGS